MPIEIPRLSVTPNEEQLHAPRVQSQGIDAVTPMQRDLGSIEGVAKDAIKLHQEMQHQQADTTATNNANEYLLWRKKRLYGDPETGWAGYTNMTGADPQELYKQFDKEQSDKLDELSKPSGDATWSNETQNLVNRRLSRHYEETQLETLTAYSHQKKKYDDGVADTGVSIAQQGMYGASSFIVPGDSSSFGQLEAKIAGIRNTRIAQGMKNFGAVEDENGDTSYNDGSGPKSVKLTQSVKYQIAKDISDGLADATKNLVDSKELDKAKALKDWADQNGYIDNTNMGKIDDKLQKAELKQKAYAAADDAIKTNSPENLDKIQDPELRIEAKKILNEEQRYNEQETKRKSKSFYDPLANHVLQVMQSDHPYKGILDMQNDPMYMKAIDNITDPKQRKALDHMVEQPSFTPDNVTSKWVDLMTGKIPGVSLNGMSTSDLMQYTAGMKTADKKEAMTTYVKMNSQTGSQMETEYRNFGKEFDQQAIGAQLLKKVPNSNFFTASDQIKEAQWKKELLDTLDPNKQMNPKERSDYVAQFIANKKAGTVFSPPQKQPFNGGPSKAPVPAAGANEAPPVTPKTDPVKYLGNLNPYQRMQAIQDYRKQPGQSKAIPTDAQLADFLGHK
jgi:hypothetical protein